MRGGMPGMLPCAESCERNKGPILSVLEQVFGATRLVLEIGCGTGQHAVHFARHLPHLVWQPTDRPGTLDWAAQRIREQGPQNVSPPLALDVADHPWGLEADGVFSANTLHIMSWPEVEHFFTGVGQALAPAGLVCVYGPFRYEGRYTSDSNAAFDRSLKSQGGHMGIRDFERVDDLARAQGLCLEQDHAMPANNQLLVWRMDRSAAGHSQ